MPEIVASQDQFTTSFDSTSRRLFLYKPGAAYVDCREEPFVGTRGSLFYLRKRGVCVGFKIVLDKPLEMIGQTVGDCLRCQPELFVERIKRVFGPFYDALAQKSLLTQ